MTFFIHISDTDESTSNSSSSSGEDDEAANTVDFWFKPSKFFLMAERNK